MLEENDFETNKRTLRNPRQWGMESSGSPLPSRHRLLVALGALAVGARAQQRCRPEKVVSSDGSFNFGSCTEATLFGRRIGDEGVERLVKAIPPRLKLLDLWNNGIGRQGAVALGSFLETNTGLEKLFLNENEIGPEGAAALARGLAKNRGLTTLWLSSSGIGDKGATALADALANTRAAKCGLPAPALLRQLAPLSPMTTPYLAPPSPSPLFPRLEVLDIWNNSIGATGAAAIAKALESNHRLRTLELRLNRIGDAGAASFAALMPKNVRRPDRRGPPAKQRPTGSDPHSPPSPSRCRCRCPRST